MVLAPTADGMADLHVVGRDAFGDATRRSATRKNQRDVSSSYSKDGTSFPTNCAKAKRLETGDVVDPSISCLVVTRWLIPARPAKRKESLALSSRSSEIG